MTKKARTQNEASPKYTTKLSKIGRGLSAGKGARFKDKSAIKKFFHSL